MPALRLLSLTTTQGGWDAAARTVEDAEVDLACLHGAPSLLRWRSRCAAIARRAGLVTVAGGRTTGGALLLSTLGVDVTAAREIPFGRGPRPPGAALARMALRGSPFVVAGARVPADAGQRLRAAVAALDPAAPPAIVLLADPDSAPPWPGLDAVAGGVHADPRVRVTETVRIPGGVRVELELPG